MKVLIQVVDRAKLVSENFVSEIKKGLLVFVGVSKLDTDEDVKYLAKRLVNLRVFDDEYGKTNLSVLDVLGDIMIVSNFTLQADTKKGTRPDFFKAGNREFALDKYNKFIDEVQQFGIKNVAIGSFGNYMNIETNLSGPFTVQLESEGR